MKKNTLLLVGAGIVVALIGGFVFLRSNGSDNPMSQLQNTLTAGGSMKCEYVDEDNRTIVSYMKDEKVRSEFTGPDGSGGMIYNEDAMWTWDNETKQGYTMIFPEYPETDEFDESESEYDFGLDESNERDEMEAELEEHKESCKNQHISDDMFDPPADITFQDMEEFMNAMPEVQMPY